MEYERKVMISDFNDEEKKTEKMQIFCSIFVDEKNVAEESLSKGLTEFIRPRGDEETTAFSEELSEAAEKAKAKKLGVYNER